MNGQVVELTDIRRTFGTVPPVHALQGVTLQIEHGEFVAVVGPSGSGKSTLLSILGLLDTPTAGTYRLDGVEVSQFTEKELSTARAIRIGFVFQAFHLLEHRSIEENVEVGEIYRPSDRRRRRERSVAVLERVGLGHRIGFRPSLLSGGERQRVAIARAMMGNPTLLLCDEPTGNLDSQTTEDVLELLASLRSGQLTIVVITHNPALAARADRIIGLLDGRVVT